jgi:LmbE family N-acetylglucosaminyl deacetylase
MFNARRALVVVAHPDDEVLGCGGTVRRMADAGIEVAVCILSGTVRARNVRPADDELRSDICQAMTILGAKLLDVGEFENIQFNTVPHLQIVQFIEDAIRKSEPDVVFTHHPSDLNNDHTQTSLACQAAIRLPQRNGKVSPISEFYYVEIPSSTDWAVPSGGQPFQATTFVDIEAGIAAKLKALETYRDVMRPRPHPRSTEVIQALAVCRGAQSGFNYAEAFQLAFRRV